MRRRHRISQAKLGQRVQSGAKISRHQGHAQKLSKLPSLKPHSFRSAIQTRPLGKDQSEPEKGVEIWSKLWYN